MQREILFRGKRVDNGKWVEGYLFNGIVSYGIITNEKYLGHWDEVIPDTVGQYIGLLDKNGKKIFEGDYYRQEDSDNNTSVVICVFIQEISAFCWLNDYEYLDYLDNGFDSLNDNGVPFNCDEIDCDIISIAGNIIDNPIDELLQRT